MPRKKIEVVELNKKTEKIVLAENQSPLLLFWHNHFFLIFLTLFILSCTVLGVGIFLNIKNARVSEPLVIKEVSIDTDLDEYNAQIGLQDVTISEENAIKYFENSGPFGGKGEVLLVQTIEHSRYTIKYYSDGTALKIMKSNGKTTRISALENGDYGISKDGVVSSKATISDVTINNQKTFPWGVVTYYSDGSAEITNSKMDVFVRKAEDINEKYISDNKVTYLKESKTIGNNKLNYYYDGTIEVVKNNISYLVRTIDDLNITNNNVTFKNNNQATIISTKKMNNGIVIDYYSDGGAIIKDGTRTLSVRKSNSIIIKNNNIYEIVDNIYVQVSKKTNNNIYYTNGSAVVTYGDKVYYVHENSDIKYNTNNSINKIGSNVEVLSRETSIDKENIKTFEKTAVVTTDKYIAILPQDGILVDDKGKIKDIINTDDLGDIIHKFTINNNTNQDLRYRVVIERSPKTTVDVQYLRYILSTKDKTLSPSRLDANIWKQDDIAKVLNVTGTNYILIDSTIEAQDTQSISIMLWTDYETIPNSMQNKYFYGTIKVYAWTEQ